MFKAFRKLLSRSQAPGRARLTSETWPAAIYAIGDVHGRYDLLRALEKQIADDAVAYDGEKWLVTLGDYVDRGAQSASVLDHLTGAAPNGFRRVSLCGNHEQMMLDFIAAPVWPSSWLDYGGIETLRSYGIAVEASRGEPRRLRALIESHIPEEHLQFLRELPVCLALPGFVFVHAGIRPGIPVEEQSEEDLLWIRHEFLDAQLPAGLTVVHGHTPMPEPVVTPQRISIDTGAFATGRLTGVRIVPGEPAHLLTAAI